ncbi:MAG: hypothetical protein Ct9H300mP18_11140 [Candidatus Neomarinimicrobiota bacterium]|nr:MAG: hypothetical protein Ct9H300mP18_11140 [Candidatus Neomarinimicrobiota bacterium]
MDQLQIQLKDNVDVDADWAENQEHPDSSTATNYIYSGYVPEYNGNPEFSKDKTVFVDAVNHALAEEMDRNKRMIVYGQDIADPKGGVFTATKGLSSKYGKRKSL